MKVDHGGDHMYIYIYIYTYPDPVTMVCFQSPLKFDATRNAPENMTREQHKQRRKQRTKLCQSGVSDNRLLVGPGIFSAASKVGS